MKTRIKSGLSYFVLFHNSENCPEGWIDFPNDLENFPDGRIDFQNDLGNFPDGWIDLLYDSGNFFDELNALLKESYYLEKIDRIPRNKEDKLKYCLGWNKKDHQFLNA